MKKATTTILILIAALHLILGIWWLAAGWGIVLFLFWIVTSSAKPVVRFRKMTYLVYSMVIIGAVLAAITFKTLFFGIYVIPSGSMERTIVPGDVVWVNNLSYGPRLPYSPYEISWINLLVWFWEGKDADVKKRWWNYKRLKGYSSPQRGDISVFNHPYNNTIFIKRIVALPGDTLQIIDGQLMINGWEQVKPKNSVYYSRARFKDRHDAYAILDSLHINMFQNTTHHEAVQFNGQITHKELQALQLHPQVTDASIDPCRPDTAWGVYPHSEHIDWSIDNYGPYRLPFKGMVVEISPENIWVYGQLMHHEGQFRPESERDSAGHFTFYNDYYFIMGDNFHDSDDSRYFGPVMEEFLIGKASFIMFSKSKNHKKASRILRRFE
jgi:signal peptidase I